MHHFEDNDSKKLFEYMKLHPSDSRKKLMSLGFTRYLVTQRYMHNLRIIIGK